MQFNINGWDFDIKQIFARKTDKHGNPYKASAVITKNTKGTHEIEMLTSQGDEQLNKLDFQTLKDAIKVLTGEEQPDIDYTRIKRGKTKQVTR